MADNKLARSTNWPLVILVTNLYGTGACPGPTTKAFSTLGRGRAELASAWGMDRPVANNGDIEEATRLKELGDEVASSGMNVGIKEGT